MKASPWIAAALLAAASAAAQADAVDTLREFVREAKTGRAAFTQTVSSPDGAKKRSSSGRFEFARPDRFRFAYAKPFEQLIVGDGQKVWLYDADLNQVSVRPMEGALGATPAALLAGTALERDFNLSVQPSAQGLDWALAVPKQKDGAFQSLKIGFRGKVLAAVEIVDGFGQRSLLEFSDVQTNVPLADGAFRFTAPKDASVLRQP